MPITKEDITVSLVRRLVATQFPQWAALPIRPVELDGWDNTTFRLGEAMTVRLPSAEGYAAQVVAQLKAAGLRAEADMRSERMNAKIRDAQLQKSPYMLIVGDREAEAGAVSVRTRNNEDRGAVPLVEFIARTVALVEAKSLEL